MDQVFEWVNNRKQELTVALAQAAFDKRQSDVDELCGALKEYGYFLAQMAEANKELTLTLTPDAFDFPSRTEKTEEENV